MLCTDLVHNRRKRKVALMVDKRQMKRTVQVEILQCRILLEMII